MHLQNKLYYSLLSCSVFKIHRITTVIYTSKYILILITAGLLWPARTSSSTTWRRSLRTQWGWPDSPRRMLQRLPWCQCHKTFPPLSLKLWQNSIIFGINGVTKWCCDLCHWWCDIFVTDAMINKYNLCHWCCDKILLICHWNCSKTFSPLSLKLWQNNIILIVTIVVTK